ncbi:MAG: TrkA family potassium uptake protein [Chloroflexi bacterium]|nr:TrkA family potassium uptake protein [Chloroflexota bacterium]
MYIVIVGGGRVGYYLTKALLDEGHEVVVVEKNAAVCTAINEELGSICVRGDGCEATMLAEIGTGRADMLMAVTGDDEDNLIACQVAKYKFNVRRTIARIRNPKNEALFKKLGVDVAISTTNIILEHIEEEVPTHPLTHLMAIEGERLAVVEVKITPELATVGKPIKQLSVPPEARLILIIGANDKYRMPTPNAALKAGDRIIALTPHEKEAELRIALRGA